MRSEKRRDGRHGLLLLATVTMSSVVAGCASSDFHPWQLDPKVSRAQPSLVVFFVDGMDCARLGQMLASGELPNIRRVFVEGGVQVRHAVSSLPSITYPNCSSMITGRFPGHHGIMGNYWFDRDTLFARYYMTFDTYLTVNDHLQAATIYDALYDEFTLNIQDHTRKGVTRTIDNRKMFEAAWVMGWYNMADRHVGDTMDKVVEKANRAGRWPRVVMTYYPGVDEIGHRSGSRSARYGRALQTVDEVVGKVSRQTEACGLGGSIYFVLVTDHSLPPVERHVDILQWLKQQRGAKLRVDPVLNREYADRARLMARYDTVVGVDSGRVAAIHLLSECGWSRRPTEKQVLEWMNREPPLLDVPAVEMAAIRAGQDRARVLSREGTAVIERRTEGGAKQYRVTGQSGDVLHLTGRAEYAAFVEQGWHGTREWLAASVEEAYPDLVAQVVEMFDSNHTADVVLFARQGWSFAFGPAENGGHGSCLASDMCVPMMFSGPGLPKGAAIECARVVDVAPTLLGLIGEADRIESLGEIDGINLADELRAAK